MTGTTRPPTSMPLTRPPLVPTRMCRKLGRPMRVPCSLTMSTVAAGATSPRSTRYAPSGPLADPVADDVATLGLDLLLRDEGWRRLGVNAFLTGC